ncbi:translation elongation factor 4 [Candidatus Saccharibacteria bacterium]|jgi:GTP-binding protein LepA|nr:translation elongation factor 4 [Candidatus Saccharibacteria bacterium]HOR23150.1 translation elongation factor 4 [Candidatus Saccharibacteria bacterium]HPW47813.1 translation elongation factor 4 [Candidatus Saccharibacteria bacterium]
MEKIRNFCIIAHIDHGKSTLADRLIELTDAVDKRLMRERVLDRMDLEREKGITIKLQPVRMQYKDYELNLIDTPGHVDFSYEVSRSLAACEGAVLVIDATQGVQAQTLANVYLALSAGLKIIPVLNKVDLPAADVDRVSVEVASLLKCSKDEIIQVSAKTGVGVDSVLKAIIERIPSPSGKPSQPLKALIFDSYFDDYRGVVLYVRVVDGELKRGAQIHMTAASKNGLALEVGSLKPELRTTSGLKCGEIGYVVTNFKSTADARVGDTLTTFDKKSDVTPLPGYKEVKPFVYAGIFPSSSKDYQLLKNAIAKLQLNDSALVYEPENSPVLGFGFRVGFLGLLHMEIVRERLEREYNLEIIVTNPSTNYQVLLNDNREIEIKSANDLPEMANVKSIKEPWVKGEIVCLKHSVGSVIQLINQTRGSQGDINFVDNHLVIIEFNAPLSNILTDFYDRLKSITSGYGSFSYDLDGYFAGELVKLDFYVANEKIDALSVIVHKNEADKIGREVVAKLKTIIPRQLFKVSLQAAIGSRVLAREDIPMLKKDVTGYLYGGDVSRKKKLWAKQKRGKTRLKKFGKVDMPTEAFQVMLKRE